MANLCPACVAHLNSEIIRPLSSPFRPRGGKIASADNTLDCRARLGKDSLLIIAIRHFTFKKLLRFARASRTMFFTPSTRTWQPGKPFRRWAFPQVVQRYPDVNLLCGLIATRDLRELADVAHFTSPSLLAVDPVEDGCLALLDLLHLMDLVTKQDATEPVEGT